MSNFYTYQNLKSTIIQVLETKKQLQKLQQKVDNLPHPAVLGNSLLKIKNKFEVVKLKNELGNENMTFDGLKTLFDKYNTALRTVNESINNLKQKLSVYNQ